MCSLTVVHSTSLGLDALVRRMMTAEANLTVYSTSTLKGSLLFRTRNEIEKSPK